MPRPIMLGVVGDSGSGKTTLTRGLVRIIGEAQVTRVAADDYHRYDRRQRAEHNITPLDPRGNYLDVLEKDLAHLRAGEPVLKPIYRHSDGSFLPSQYLRPAEFTIVEGMLGFHTAAMREAYDVRVYMAPPEDLRRQWKVQRDITRRGYTTDAVLAELDRREGDAEVYIRPQQRFADIVVSFMPGENGDQDRLDGLVKMRPSLPHPDLSPFVDEDGSGITLAEQRSETHLFVPGSISPDRAAAVEEAVWDRMHFASHLRTERLGVFAVGHQLHRSESLAIVQVLILYQLVTARAAVALGSPGVRVDTR
ncbi:MAG TPA: phosphoribulokinase [Solirubrobacteraceae bacterium]|nr:phosphoribulokinase [Solirubrobacteraceae bacterium]